ncbi:hypothetical protein ABG79_00338 [Caloramator mitchellensis]|uniref:Uncharacterized protein n=1 Tax=Caloramator mitchellensis TaxID=908809 RepID=A0A0R3JVI7_CALMK|nr:hypothetical protein [Caloramator mitchellensis]KRQ87537.1 hypothetical protein ABG79_00338 [Caloramator mitchellensis]
MRFIEYAMWFIILLTTVITFLTIMVSYGLFYISHFTTLLPFEVSMVLVLLLWGIYNIYNNYRQSRNAVIISFLLGGIMLLFILFGIY